MLKAEIKRLLLGEGFDADEMARAVGVIMDGEGSPAQIAAFLVALRLKGETSAEIEGAARAMRDRMTRVDLEFDDLVDTCGTGGDGASTFNVSTAAAFVAAAAGARVAKHGNRAVSSRSGSADLLTALGIRLDVSVATCAQAIRELGIAFLFAPSHHPAMKHATPVRRELGARTIFNVLGPLTNPAGAPHQVLGVFDKALAAPMAEVLGRLGSKRAWVVHGADGIDEMTVCDQTFVAEWDGTAVREWTLDPANLGLARAPSEALHGGTPEENTKITEELLRGQRPGALEDIVALNAGAALVVSGKAPNLTEALERARETMRNGSAWEKVKALVELTQEG